MSIQELTERKRLMLQVWHDMTFADELERTQDDVDEEDA